MLEVRQQLVASRKMTYGGLNPVDFITVHETANRSVGAGARAHANLQSRGNVRNASWHWQVDDKEAIQSYPHIAQCWHAGDGRGPGNLRSVGIEICVNADGDYLKAIANAAELVRRIRTEEKVPANHVVQHKTWSGKNCPTILLSGSSGITWSRFLQMCDGITGSPGAPTQQPAKPPRQQPPPLRVDGDWGRLTTAAFQRVMGTTVDGMVSNQMSTYRKRNPGLTTGWDWSGDVRDSGSQLIRAIQRVVGARVDGHIGPETIGKIQLRVGTVRDGVVSNPSQMVRAVQARLNEGRF